MTRDACGQPGNETFFKTIRVFILREGEAPRRPRPTRGGEAPCFSPPTRTRRRSPGRDRAGRRRALRVGDHRARPPGAGTASTARRAEYAGEAAGRGRRFPRRRARPRPRSRSRRGVVFVGGARRWRGRRATETRFTRFGAPSCTFAFAPRVRPRRCFSCPLARALFRPPRPPPPGPLTVAGAPPRPTARRPHGRPRRSVGSRALLRRGGTPARPRPPSLGCPPRR